MGKAWEKMALVVGSGLVYGLSIACVGIASRSMDPLALVSLRLLTASCVFAVGLAIMRPAFCWHGRLVRDIIIVGVFNVGLPFLLLALSLRYISSSLAAVMFNVGPPLTVIMAHFLLPDEPLSAGKLAGTLLAVGGATLLIVTNSSGLQAATGQGWLGQMLIVLASVAGAFALIYTRQRLRRENVTVLAGGQVFASLAVMAPLCLIFEGIPPVRSYPWQAWAALAVSAVAAPVIGFWLLFYMVNKYSASLGGFSSIATPLFSVGIGVLFLGEVLTWPILVGALLLLVGIWWLNSF
jgi:drug/metabolite transporter (DMT)-like permease